MVWIRNTKHHFPQASHQPLTSLSPTPTPSGNIFIILFFFLFATVGGTLIQFPFLAPKTVCNPDDVVLATRFLTIAQGAGLTLGALIDVTIALIVM